MVARCLRWIVILAGVSVLSFRFTDDAAARMADEPAVERFNCETADGVSLVGDFYPPGKGKGERGPCVILLHAVGPGRTSASRVDFGRLPQLLQREGFAVVAFDFRGHGESKTIDPVRYYDIYPPARPQPNQAAANKIDSREFRTNLELALMANDLTAIKVWLNKQNNLRRCNAHNVALVTVEQSGILGMIFAVNEHRDSNRLLEFTGSRVGAESRFEGDDLVGLVLLSTTDRLGGERIDPTLLQTWLQFTYARRLQLLALYGDEDAVAKEFWGRASSWLRVREKDPAPAATLKRIKGTSLVGLKLLDHEAFGARKDVVTFLTDTLQTPNVKWSEHKGNQHPTLINLPRVFGAQ